MFAVIRTGGKQYKVAADNTITVMSLEGEAGSTVIFDDVLALFDGETNHVGSPNVAGARVLGEIVDQPRGPKVIAFKKRRRKNSRRKRGYRDEITVLRITEILTDSAKPSIGPRPKREKAVAPAPVDGDDEAPTVAKKKAAPKKAVAKAAAKPRAKPAAATKTAAKDKSDKK